MKDNAATTPIFENGTVEVIGGTARIYYDGYWIRYYEPPEDTLAEKKKMIDLITRRTFHHTEPGINTRGESLENARAAYERETDPRRKRVNGAMLAGALFNRATDIFTTMVEMQRRNLKISGENELMQQCSDCFQEALELGKMVKHCSGEEGIDELWGEPLKVFTMTTEEYFNSRYIKIAQTMHAIDTITDRLCKIMSTIPEFTTLIPQFRRFAESAKLESEIIRSDPVNFEVWPRYVADGEILMEFELPPDDRSDPERRVMLERGLALIRDGRNVITYLAGVRVPMPKTLKEYLHRCDQFHETYQNH